ncbi:hypothetical protein CBP36_19340 (plasmid) [Acidovorax carolinensis]|uniref:Ankyrin repeat domain-containing protein n=1 Tax=Acidovorax carolinensis TaxID=553814 RepID=A0A240UJ32_9BURK|nr:hypothetical protein [Acidovorax carolinensis]ART57064.1 hypothetical protein CBP35_19295 [Acidovorax carolinensis]ART61125.1 hypothetical protein CBP36_19340 [Acidovorax carolinensis]
MKTNFNSSTTPDYGDAVVNMDSATLEKAFKEGADFRLYSREFRGETPHFIALATALRENTNSATLKSRIVIAKKFLALGGERAPVICLRASNNSAGAAFFEPRWRPEFGPELMNLMSDYVAAGILDLNEPLDFRTSDVGAMAPLTAKIRSGDVWAVRALISCGCDITFALDSEFDNLEDQARSFGHANEDELVAAIKEATMAREISKHASVAKH